MPIFKHKEIFLSKNIARLADEIVIGSKFVLKIQNTPDNFTLSGGLTAEGCACWFRGGNLPPPKVPPPASGVSEGGCYATEHT